MITLYWGLEFTKVLLCYLFILFIWPSVVFYKYLKNKSKIYRFCFCATTQIVLINTAVLGLGLGYLLNPWVVNILFYGSLLFSAVKLALPAVSLRKDMHKLTTGTLGRRSFWSSCWGRFVSWLRRLCGSLWREMRPHLIEYVLLLAIVAYGIFYFSYSSLVEYSYGYGDMYTHHGWVNGLVQGQVFSGGVYPEGMHCVLYLMHTISGLSVYSCTLYLGCIHVAILLLSVYCLMREIFRWRGTPLLVLVLFLVAAMNNRDAVMSMSRLQGTLPGDYGLHTMYLCALFLLRFLKEGFQEGWQQDPRAWLKNENLIVFSMSLAASVTIHYYVTITAFFICLPFAIVYIRQVFSRARFLLLVAAVRFSVIVAVLPVVVALLSGIRIQGSLYWAVNVINGFTTEAHVEELEPAGTESPEASAEPSVFPRLRGVWSAVRDKADIFYQRYGYLLGKTLGIWIVLLSVLLTLFWLACMFSRHLHAAVGIVDGYIPIIGASFFIMILYAAPYIGLPELISYNRLPSTAYLLLFMVAMIPVDMLLCTLQRFSPNWLRQTAPMICVAAICVVTLTTGHYHGYLYKILSRYRSAVDVTNSITRSFPEKTYTIVSTTDELSSIVPHGYHEELLEFLKAVEGGQMYYLPTEYVFVYVEKRPLLHSQSHFVSGPAWLATDIYADSRALEEEASKQPEIFASQITANDAQRSVLGYPTTYSTYAGLDSRTVINSKAYKWCQDFADLYKYEMNIYYEDEDFICYYFRQNPYSLYNLSIWD